MNVYPLAIDEGFGVGAIDYLGDTIVAVLVSDAYTYSALHQFADDLPAGADLSTVELEDKTIANGCFSAADVTFPAVAIGDTATAIVVLQDTGTPATSRLIAYVDRKADTVPISVETNDGDVAFTWARERIFRL